MKQQQLLAIARANFIEHLHQEFMAEKGYGAYVYLTSYGAVMLFNQFLEQQQSEKDFIKAYVSSFVRG
ncbi:MAG: hypothetical protein ACU85E_05880 [Gammaproteobacteria bacterium]